VFCVLLCFVPFVCFLFWSFYPFVFLFVFFFPFCLCVFGFYVFLVGVRLGISFL